MSERPEMRAPKLMLVTPAMAKRWLDTTNLRNRNFLPGKIDQYAADMAAGAWALTHQGIAFGENKMLLDGQNRLAAIVKAGVPVWMWVWGDVPVEQNRGVTLVTQDCIDNGGVRSTAQQLRLSYGVANPNVVAAAFKTIRDIAIGSNVRSMSMAQTAFTRQLYGKHVDAILSLGWTGISRRASIFGTLSFCREVALSATDEFAAKFLSMENIAKTSPVMVLMKWNQMHGGTATTSTQRRTFCKIVAGCLLRYIEGKPMERVTTTDDALEHFRSKQKAKVSQICAMCGVDKAATT